MQPIFLEFFKTKMFFFQLTSFESKYISRPNHRSRETRINSVFQFAPGKLGRFETRGWNFLVFKNLLFFPIRPRAKFVRFPVVYGRTMQICSLCQMRNEGQRRLKHEEKRDQDIKLETTKNGVLEIK